MKQRLKFPVLTSAAMTALLLLPSTGTPFSKARKTPVQNGSEKIAHISLQSSTETDGVPKLDQVLDRGLNGLPTDPSVLIKLYEFAERFVESRKSRTSLECESVDHPVSTDPFCNLVPEATASLSSAQQRSPKIRKAEARKLAQDMKQERFEVLQNVPEATFMSVLKTLTPGDFESVAHAAVKAPTCPSTALLTALGLKLEEKLPDPKIQQLLSKVYDRALACSPNIAEDGSAIKSAYRSGLLNVAAGDFQKAEELFAKIVATPSVFRTRILYWRHFCAQKLNNPTLQDETRKALLREAPLSLHGLMVSGTNLTLTTPGLTNSDEPRVFFRSRSRPELNASILAAELMHASNRPELAYKLLIPALDPVLGAEPEFQIYVAVLLMRSGDVLRKFQLITSVFRDNPSYISNASMRMLYPLRSLELMNDLSTLDPFLIVSLIRQESAFNHKARSPAGAMGLMQLMPTTARRMERQTPKRRLYDPQINVRIGVKYFNQLMEKYDGSAELALAAYNAGPARVNDWVKRYPVEDRMLFVDLIPFRETREYVASIVRNYYFYLKLYEQEWLRRSPQNKPSFGKSPLFSFVIFNEPLKETSKVR
ncbi:MAG TPA: hypothetical protein DCS07_17405 [Bdellovibrionales bacterium]|nr:hypothetical protein [Bdellovibrionales bacterium]